MGTALTVRMISVTGSAWVFGWVPFSQQDLQGTREPNRATDARYTITHDGGSAYVTKNQEINGSHVKIRPTQR
jgi:hypothetical protein